MASWVGAHANKAHWRRDHAAQGKGSALDNLFGSSDVSACWDKQGPEQRFKERRTPAASVVHELEEAHVQGQLVLRDTPVRAQPATQQRPAALHRVDMHLSPSS